MEPPRRTIAEIDAHYLPKITAAKAKAEERRDAAWLAIPAAICGVPVRPMTLADYLALHLAGNAHVCANAGPGEVEGSAAFWAMHDGIFLWRISVAYAPSAEAREAFMARHQVAAIDLIELHAAIADYLRAIFADRPAPPATTSTAENDQVPLSIAASFAACWIHDFAAAYGWIDEHVLAMPLPRIFQLRHLLRVDADLKAGRRPRPAGDEADSLAAAAFAEIAALAP
jgi:hypothetical protein